MARRALPGATAFTAVALLPAAVLAQGATVVLPTIEVVESAPGSKADLDRNKLPSNVQTLSPQDFDRAKSISLTDAMARALPGVSLGDATGNSYQPDINYRGFVASPVVGTPQGLAIYQNGTRINEVFGDTVNWDFIPEAAINRMTLAPNNPIYGLNALGGAISIEMKNGFNYQGVEVTGVGGSFGHFGAGIQAGVQQGNFAAYVAADGITDKGWRDFDSFSRIRRIYADLGWRNDEAEFHLSFTGASNKFGAVAATPVEMLNQRWSSVFTFPQTTENKLAFLQANGTWRPTDTLTLQANAYYRGFWQSHVDGNQSDALPCAAPLAGQVCFDDNDVPLLDLNGNPVANLFGPDPSFGQIDRTWTTANSFGGSVQATSAAQVNGHDNHLVVGASLDHGRVQFTANSELGIIDLNNLFVNGTGVIIQQPDPTADSVLLPVSLRATTNYTGIYATDTFDITEKLSLTAGGRFNIAHIKLDDELGGALSSDNTFQRFNPVVGLTYKFLPTLTGYAGYSESNRAPTPLELGCSDPARPCLIDNFLISDPPLKQVVGHTYEAGLRGQIPIGSAPEIVTKEKGKIPAGSRGLLSWSLGVFRTDSDDDIINVASTQAGRGFFLNAGTTRRQGVEASVNYREDRWNAYANYTFVDATFRDALTLAQPNNPFADADGNIFVVPGNHLAAVPAHRFKIGAEYNVTDKWLIGADAVYVGEQYLIGDESNQNPKVPAYWVVNLHTSYHVNEHVEVFGLVRNLFNQHYYAAGTFFETGGINGLTFNDPRTFLPGAPLAAYAGVRAKF